MRRLASPVCLRTILIRGAAVALLLTVFNRCGMAPAYALHPPLLLIVEQDTVLYAPDGQRIAIPGGTELDVCAQDNALVIYDLEPVVLRVPVPCSERPLFADGFEETER